MAIEPSPAGLLGAIAADLHISVVAIGTMTTFYPGVLKGPDASTARTREFAAVVRVAEPKSQDFILRVPVMNP